MMVDILGLHPQRLGFFLNIGFLFSIILSAAYGSQLIEAQLFFSSPALLLGMLLSLGSLSFVIRRRIAGLTMGSLLVLVSAISLYLLMDKPFKGYLIICLLGLSAFFLRDMEGAEPLKAYDFRRKLFLSLAAFSAINWSLVHILHLASNSITHSAVLVSTLLCLYLAFLDYRHGRRQSLGSLTLLCLSVAILVFGTLLSQRSYIETASRLSIVVPLYAFIVAGGHLRLKTRIINWIESLFFHPEGGIIMLFLVLCGAGTFALSIPVSSLRSGGLSLLEAAFTAVSAVCVTGLSLFDITRELSTAGQVFLLILIQIGGLGIMTLSALALFIMGHRLSVQQEATLAKILGHKLKDRIQSTIKRIILFTITCETIGALLLTLLFLADGLPWSTALWRGFFTAISAFCNAGFALDTNNLIPLQLNPLALHTIAALIILGGLSPGFVMGIPLLFKQGVVPVQTKLIIISSLLLLFGGTLLIAIFEWNHSMVHLEAWDKIHNAWFQSVTTRSAGFNSIQTEQMTQPTAFLMIALMFVGGSPGGTAGGIRTTTLAIAFALIYCVIRGRTQVTIFRRTIAYITVYRTLTVILVHAGIGLVATLCIVASQNLDLTAVIFEVFSALGTTGLSLGLTAKLNEANQVIVMLCMFLGRIGTLSLFLFLLEQPASKRWIYPSEEIVVS